MASVLSEFIRPGLLMGVKIVKGVMYTLMLGNVNSNKLGEL